MSWIGRYYKRFILNVDNWSSTKTKINKSNEFSPNQESVLEGLEVLKGCNCDEYGELELIIKTRGSKIY